MREVLPLIPFEKTTETSLFKLAVDYRHIGQVLEIRYLLKGPLDQLIWPKADNDPSYREGLWTQTCFECFYKPEGSDAYLEWNFSPNGDWWNMSFLNYRNRDPSFRPPQLKNQARAKISSAEFRLEVAIPLIKLPANVGWMAILQHREGTFSHWSLKHFGAKPDFHHAKSLSHYLDTAEDQ